MVNSIRFIFTLANFGLVLVSFGQIGFPFLSYYEQSISFDTSKCKYSATTEIYRSSIFRTEEELLSESTYIAGRIRSRRFYSTTEMSRLYSFEFSELANELNMVTVTYPNCANSIFIFNHLNDSVVLIKQSGIEGYGEIVRNKYTESDKIMWVSIQEVENDWVKYIENFKNNGNYELYVQRKNQNNEDVWKYKEIIYDGRNWDLFEYDPSGVIEVHQRFASIDDSASWYYSKINNFYEKTLYVNVRTYDSLNYRTNRKKVTRLYGLRRKDSVCFVYCPAYSPSTIYGPR